MGMGAMTVYRNRVYELATLGTILVSILLIAWMLTGIQLLPTLIIIFATPTTILWWIWIISMIYYSHPSAKPEETIQTLEWLDSFLTNSYAQIEGLDKNSLEYERKSELLGKLSLLWSEASLMAKGLSEFKNLTEEIQKATDFESVQTILKETWTKS